MKIKRDDDSRFVEYQAVEVFVQHCIDDDMTQFTHVDISALAFNLRKNISTIRAELESYGLSLAPRAILASTRGFKSNSHDRWTGPGSSPTHGGSGIDTTTGRATVTNVSI